MFLKLRAIPSLLMISIILSSLDHAETRLFGRKKKRRVEYRDAKLSVVDMHLHTGIWSDIPDSFQEQVTSFLPSPIDLFPGFATNTILSAVGIAAQLWSAKVCHGVLIAVYAPDTTGLTTNEFVLDKIDKLPHRFHGLASLSVENWPTNQAVALDNLRYHLELPGFIGIKMAHPHQGINFTDSTYYPIYDVADDLNVPVFVHTGLAGSPESLANPESTHPAFFEDVIQTYPNVSFILGHMGKGANFEGLEDPLDACLRLARTYPNVYLEASTIGTSTNDPDGEKLLNVYERVKSSSLTQRIVYGSDGPQFPGYVGTYLESTLIALDRANFTEDEAEDVLFNNFVQLFGLDQDENLDDCM